MYWVKNEDGSFEVLDGQQRSSSICEYVKNKFPIDYKQFNNLTNDEKEQILNYELMVYFCEGDDSEKLAWFEIVNIAGAVLTPQELRNAVYTGTWFSDAKRYFSKTNQRSLSHNRFKRNSRWAYVVHVGVNKPAQTNVGTGMTMITSRTATTSLACLALVA